MTEERFKAWYHGALAIASLAEVFTATTRLRKALLLGAAGWHAHCLAQHIEDEPRSYTFPNHPVVRSYTFPNHPVVPRKTVVFDQEHCTAWEEIRDKGRIEPRGCV